MTGVTKLRSQISFDTDLSAGSYTIIITDVNACRDTVEIVLDNIGAITASLIEKRDNRCSTGNGFIRLTAGAGQIPYAYTWSHDATLTDSLATDLPAGVYDVTVTDNIGCVDIISQTIVDIDIFNSMVDSITASGCDTASGTVALITSGGLGSVAYSWSHDIGLNASFADSLAAGSYDISVTDSLGCLVIVTAVVPTSIGPSIMLLSTTNSFCGPNMGQAVVTATGGSAPYTYEWSHNASISDSFAIDLPSGGITVTVRDANNCTSLTSFIIDETTPVVLSI